MEIPVVICRTCGYFRGNINEYKSCPACGNKLEEVDLPIKDLINMSTSERDAYRLKQLGVNPSEEMENLRMRYDEKIDRELASIPKPVRVQCPYCKSFNTKKISATSRMFSTNLFGLASNKIGKQWHCNSCKSDF